MSKFKSTGSACQLTVVLWLRTPLKDFVVIFWLQQ